MTETPNPPYTQPLGNGFTLRTPAGSEDMARVAEFQTTIFDAAVGRMMASLLERHPYMTPADQVFVEDAQGRIVSALCLIPWTWRYGCVELPVGEMGVVGTAADRRGQGLVRSQVAYFKERLRARGCLLSCIQGIPFYYRQFGYEYALPLEGGWRLELHQVPDLPTPSAEERTYTVRAATLDDLPTLQALYEEAARPLAIHAVRDAATWRYLLEPYTTPHATSRQTLVICDASGAIAGYARLPEFHFGRELVVDEVSRLRYDAGLTLLHHLRGQAAAAGQPFIRLNLPTQSDLVLLAKALGAADQGVYAWQIYLPDVAALLRGVAPTLEERLASSLFAGLTRTVRLSFYREGLALRFEDGRLIEVTPQPRSEPADVSLPLMAFVPLFLGHRTLEELRHAYPDVNVSGEWRLLLNILFPRTDAFIYPSY